MHQAGSEDALTFKETWFSCVMEKAAGHLWSARDDLQSFAA